MDFRFKVIVAINLDIDTYFEMGDYRAFRIKSVKIGDLKTLEVIELSLCEYPDLLSKFDISYGSVVLIKDGRYILFDLRNSEIIDTFYGKSVSDFCSVEINGKPVKKTAYCVGNLVDSNIGIVRFVYKSRTSRIEIKNRSSYTLIKNFKLIRLNSTGGVKVELLDSAIDFNSSYEIGDYMGFYSNAYKLFDRLIVNISECNGTFISPSDCSRLILHGSLLDCLDNIVLNSSIKDVSICVGIKIRNITVTNGVNFNVLKKLLWLYVFTNGTVGREKDSKSVKHKIYTCNSIESLKKVKLGSSTLGNLVNIIELK